MRLLVIRHGESEADLMDVHEGRADFPLTARGHRQAAAMAEYVREHYHITAIYCSTLRRAYQTAEHLARETGAALFPEEKLMEFNNGLIAGMERKAAAEKYPEVNNLPMHASVYEQESALEFRFRAEYMLSKILADAEQPPDASANAGDAKQPLELSSDVGDTKRPLELSSDVGDAKRPLELSSNAGDAEQPPDAPVNAGDAKQPPEAPSDAASTKQPPDASAVPAVAVVAHGGMINQLYRAFLRLPVECDLFFGTGDTGIHEWDIAQGRRRVVRANLTAHCQGI